MNPQPAVSGSLPGETLRAQRLPCIPQALLWAQASWRHPRRTGNTPGCVPPIGTPRSLEVCSGPALWVGGGHPLAFRGHPGRGEGTL